MHESRWCYTSTHTDHEAYPNRNAEFRRAPPRAHRSASGRKTKRRAAAVAAAAPAGEGPRTPPSRLQRGGAVIAVIYKPIDHPKIPKWEMQLSSAAVCMNLLNCAQSMGYAAQWLTEWYAYNNKMLERLGGDINKDLISGFIYIGMKIDEPTERKRPNPSDVITYL